MNDWMNWLAQYLNYEWNCGFHTHISWHRVYLSDCFFFINFQHTESNPGDFQICWRICCSYTDCEIKFFQLFRHSKTWRHSSASQYKIPVLLTNSIVHFQTFQSFHYRLTSVLFLQLFLTLYQKTNPTKHIFPITPLMTVGTVKLNFYSRTRNVFRIVRYKTESKNVSGWREF